MKQNNFCCVCLSKIRFTSSKTIQTCKVCVNTHVCKNCFDVMRQTNIHRRCPVCRSENWCAHSVEVLIITDTEPVSQPVTSIQVVSLDREQQSSSRSDQGISLCVKLVNFLINGITFIVIIGSIGFIVMSVMHRNFYQYELIYVILVSLFVGTIIYMLGSYCRTIILSDVQQ